jgi:hypothetical protein
MTQVSDVPVGLLFLSAYRYSFDIFGTLFCHTKIQIKFEFGFNQLFFPEVMALELRKISRIISFSHFFLSAYRYSFNI